MSKQYSNENTFANLNAIKKVIRGDRVSRHNESIRGLRCQTNGVGFKVKMY